MSASQTIGGADALRPKARPLNLQNIRIDGGTQSRSALNEDVVADYAMSVRDGFDFPAVVVFFDGSDHWLADGFHRYFGYQKAGAVEIEAEIHAGTKRDAILYSVGANARHGLRRTNDDKRKAVLTLLSDEEWASWPQTKIAAACGVSQPFVSRIAADLSPDASYAENKMRTVQRNGTTYQQNTGKIGSGKSETVSDLPEEPAPKADDEAAVARAAEQAEHDRQREEHRASLPPDIQAIEAGKQERARKVPPAEGHVEELEAENVELRQENADLKTENAALRTDGAKWDGMRVQFEIGGFEKVIADKDEVIRVLETRVERESRDKVSWMNSAKFLHKELHKLGYSGNATIDIKTGRLIHG